MKTILTHKASKFIFALMAILLCSVNAMAGAKIYFNSLSISAGETQTANLMLDNDVPIVGVQYTVTLPEGLSITGKKTNTTRIVNRSHSLNVNQSDPSNNVWVITLSNTSGKTITGNSGAVAEITFTADGSFQGGNIVPVQDGVELTSEEIDANGNAVSVETEAPTLSINKLTASLNIAPAGITVSAEQPEVSLSVGITNSKPVQALSFKVALPDGISAKMDGGYVDFTYADRLPESFEVSSNYKAAENEIIFTVTCSEGETIPVGNGEIFNFRITADVKNLAETSVISFIEGIAGDENAVRTVIDVVTINVTNTQVAIDKAAAEAEAARVAANQKAAEADMAMLEALQAELTEAIKGNEEFISEADNDAIEVFLGEKYQIAIQAALDAVAEAGEYASPINEEELRAFINSVKDNIEAAKKAAAEAEAARVAANQKAAEADMTMLEALQAELTEAIKGNEEFISEADNDAIEVFLGDKYQIAIQAALDAVAEAGEYASPINEEELRAFINSVKDNIEAAKKAAAEEANDNAWAAIQAQIANVEAAIANYDTEVAKMNYASRVEGEEFNETVDAAREWVATTTETYQAKYEAGELTAEDGVKGESAEQVLAVNEALNKAAKYDINRYVQAVVYNWMGDEEDIVGKKVYVESVMETMSTAGKSALEEQVAMLEAAIQGLLNDWEAYSLYTEEAHNTLIEKAQALQANIADIVAQAEEAEKAIANDNAWAAIQAQIANVEAAIANYDTEVAKMNYASRIEGEEFNAAVDAAREWVATTTETYQAKHEAGELTAEDGVKGESAEQVLAVNEALNSAAKYDINRYVQAVVYNWMGDEEDIVGKKVYVESVMETMSTAGKSALEEQVAMLEAAIQGLLNDWEAYSLYTEEAHNTLIEKAQALQDNIAEIVAQAEEAATEKERQDNNLAAAENDINLWNELCEEATSSITQDLYEYLTPEENSYLQWLWGEEIPAAINDALQAVADEGTYQTPEILNVDEIRAKIQEIKSNLEDRKETATGIYAVNYGADNALYYHLNGAKSSGNMKGIAIKRIGNKFVKIMIK